MFVISNILNRKKKNGGSKEPENPVISCDGATDTVELEGVWEFLRHPLYGNAFVATIEINNRTSVFEKCSVSSLEDFLNNEFGDLVVAEWLIPIPGSNPPSDGGEWPASDPSRLKISSVSSEAVRVCIKRDTTQWGAC